MIKQDESEGKVDRGSQRQLVNQWLEISRIRFEENNDRKAEEEIVAKSHMIKVQNLGVADYFLNKAQRMILSSIFIQDVS